MTNLLTGDAATFASGIADWNEVTNPNNFTTAHSTADGGTLQVDVTTGGANIAVASHRSGNLDKPAVTAGTTLTLSAQCKQVTGTARGWRIECNFYDAADVAVGAQVTVVTGTTTTSFATLSGTAVVPTGATKVRMRVRWDVPAVGESFRLDNASIDDGAAPPPAVDLGNAEVLRYNGSAWTVVRTDRIT